MFELQPIPIRIRTTHHHHQPDRRKGNYYQIQIANFDKEIKKKDGIFLPLATSNQLPTPLTSSFQASGLKLKIPNFYRVGFGSRITDRSDPTGQFEIRGISKGEHTFFFLSGPTFPSESTLYFKIREIFLVSTPKISQLPFLIFLSYYHTFSSHLIFPSSILSSRLTSPHHPIVL